MLKTPDTAREGAGYVLVLGFVLVTALNGLADYTLDGVILKAYIGLITAFFGLHMVGQRWGKILNALSAAVKAWDSNNDSGNNRD